MTDTATAAKVDLFLAELSELSRKYGIAITGSPTLFEMDPEDYALSYAADDDSNLSLVGQRKTQAGVGAGRKP